MKLKDKINSEVLAQTGFDVPELGGDVKLSKKEILTALRHAKRWHEDFSQQCQNQIDMVIKNNFTLDEITEDV